MALWVSPPPQGFSQARCSSKSVTSYPAEARRSPQIAPAGPPPTMAILRMPCTSSDRKNRCKEPSREYSTEEGGGRRRAGVSVHGITTQTLKEGEDREISDQEEDEN